MSYSNPYLVRNLTPLLTNSTISDDRILESIFDVDAKIDNYLNARYLVPIQKKINLTGLFTFGEGSNTVLGSGTLFTTELNQGDVLRLNSTGEVLRVIRINSDTELICSSQAKNTYANSIADIIPSDIATVSKYLATQIILITHFSEQAYNQDTQRFNKQFEIFAKPLLSDMAKGWFLDTSLKAQETSNNLSRLIYAQSDSTSESRVYFEEELNRVF